MLFFLVCVRASAELGQLPDRNDAHVSPGGRDEPDRQPLPAALLLHLHDHHVQLVNDNRSATTCTRQPPIQRVRWPAAGLFRSLDPGSFGSSRLPFDRIRQVAFTSPSLIVSSFILAFLHTIRDTHYYFFIYAHSASASGTRACSFEHAGRARQRCNFSEKKLLNLYVLSTES